MEKGLKLLDLLFDEGEEVCVSPNEFGYKSIPISELTLGPFILEPQTEKQKPEYCKFSDIKLVSINPIKGARNDKNVTAYRSFLVELDYGPLAQQFEYVKNMKMPYTACIFSGGKSLHYAITLSTPLPSYELWSFYAEWILNVVSKADQQTKNPSRSIRMAGNLRNGVEMTPISYNTRIDQQTLVAWLSDYQSLAPIAKEKKEKIESPIDINYLPEWVQNELYYGIDKEKGRNNRWFAIAYECSLNGWDVDDIIDILGHFFEAERDFGRREWEGAIISGAKKARNG